MWWTRQSLALSLGIYGFILGNKNGISSLCEESLSGRKFTVLAITIFIIHICLVVIPLSTSASRMNGMRILCSSCRRDLHTRKLSPLVFQRVRWHRFYSTLPNSNMELG